MFQAAEAGVESRGRAGYAGALDLCGAAGRFAQDCLEHATSLLAEAHAPPVVTASARAWQPLLDDLAALESAWAPVDPARGAGEASRLLAAALAFTYADTVAVTGAPLSALPPAAAPHVRSAAAWRLLQLEPPAAHPDRDLAAWIARLEACLADERDSWSQGGGRRALSGLAPLPRPLQADPPALELISWLGVAERLVVVGEARADLGASLLAAAARTPGGERLLAEDLADPRLRAIASQLRP